MLARLSQPVGWIVAGVVIALLLAQAGCGYLKRERLSAQLTEVRAERDQLRTALEARAGEKAVALSRLDQLRRDGERTAASLDSAASAGRRLRWHNARLVSQLEAETDTLDACPEVADWVRSDLIPNAIWN